MVEVRRLSPYHTLDAKRTYPPTFLLHGAAGLAAPIEQSLKMARKLRGLGVDVGEGYAEGGAHCFEQQIEASDED